MLPMPTKVPVHHPLGAVGSWVAFSAWKVKSGRRHLHPGQVRVVPSDQGRASMVNHSTWHCRIDLQALLRRFCALWLFARWSYGLHKCLWSKCKSTQCRVKCKKPGNFGESGARWPWWQWGLHLWWDRYCWLVLLIKIELIQSDNVH